MFLKRIWSTIRFRIVLIYFLLIFIAMTVIGVFMMSQLEAYQMDLIRNNFTRIVQESVVSLREYEDFDENKEEIQADILAFAESLREEMFVVDDDFIIIASSNLNYIDKSGLDLLGQSILIKAMTGQTTEEDGISSSGIPVKTMVFPIEKDGEVKGLVCLRADVSSVYKTQQQSRNVFMRAMIVALSLTVILGFFIARSITVPINDVTEKAEKMSLGDFSQEVSVRSDDEIGRLAEMFNLLREKLNHTLTEISNEKNKLETVLKNMTDGLLALDTEGKIILANQAAMSMLNMGQEDIGEKTYDHVFGALSDDLKYDRVKENYLKGNYHDLLEKAGKTYDIRYDRYNDDQGQNAGIVVVLMDITEQQKLENMQKDFVANVSHELKTPITTIKSYTETLIDAEIEDCQVTEQFLKIIDEEADRMGRLVRELLQLSKIDHKQEQWQKRETNLISLLRATLLRVDLQATNEKLVINRLFETDKTLMVMIDRDRIGQVILNVLSNAIKYTPEGGVIDVDAKRDGDYGKITVKDNGIGMEAWEASRVFERFYRIDKARSREMGGTGLGLAIAKQIVEEHKGTIEIESEPGKGSTVTIRLPLSIKKGIRNIE